MNGITYIEFIEFITSCNCNLFYVKEDNGNYSVLAKSEHFSVQCHLSNQDEINAFETNHKPSSQECSAIDFYLQAKSEGFNLKQ